MFEIVLLSIISNVPTIYLFPGFKITFFSSAYVTLLIYTTACSCEPANKNIDSTAVDPVCDAEGDCVCPDASKNYVPGKGCVVASECCLCYLTNTAYKHGTIFRI